MSVSEEVGVRAVVSTDNGLEECMYVGDVDVWLLYHVDTETWITLGTEAETPITEDEAKEMGFQLVVHKDNPKLVLADGRVYYGCQVCWSLGTPYENKLREELLLLSVSRVLGI